MSSEFKAYYVYLGILVIASITGIVQWTRLKVEARTIVWLLLLSLATEIISLYLYTRYGTTGPTDHIFSVFEIFLTSLFFLQVLKPEHFKLWVCLVAVISPLIPLANLYYLQSFNTINTNVLLLESFVFTIAALYTLFRMMINDGVGDVIRHPPFLLVIAKLILWCGTFYYWGVGELLARKVIQYISLRNYNTYLNIFVYVLIAVAFSNYKKKISE